MRQVLISLVLTGIMVFSIVDIITIDSSRVKHLPKFFWVLLTILLSVIGTLLWFLVGRERLERRDGGRFAGAAGASQPPRRPTRPTRRGPTAPDDDPEFLSKLAREAEQQEKIRKLEERLAELDDDKPKD
jgi:hypothetical protein